MVPVMGQDIGATQGGGPPWGGTLTLPCPTDIVPVMGQDIGATPGEGRGAGEMTLDFVLDLSGPRWTDEKILISEKICLSK